MKRFFKKSMDLTNEQRLESFQQIRKCRPILDKNSWQNPITETIVIWEQEDKT